ncbi:MAG TPA: response regulator [Thermomicrobiales bacterium]|nr:response regulator [Thermomicrobiales bacterium]
MSPASDRPVKILLVEDNPGDVRLIREALREGEIRSALSVASDGLEALAYLRRAGAYAAAPRSPAAGRSGALADLRRAEAYAAPRPDLVLLDLMVPRADGWAVLRALRAPPTLRAVPVAALTASLQGRDLLLHEGLPARHYLTKPVDQAQLLALVADVATFGRAVVAHPPPLVPAGDRRWSG